MPRHNGNTRRENRPKHRAHKMKRLTRALRRLREQKGTE